MFITTSFTGRSSKNVGSKKMKMSALFDHWPHWIWARYFVFGLQPWAQNIWTGAPRVAVWSHPTVPGSAFASSQTPLPCSELVHKNRLEEWRVKAGFPIHSLKCGSLPQYEHWLSYIHFLFSGLHADSLSLSHTQKDSICFSTHRWAAQVY